MVEPQTCNSKFQALHLQTRLNAAIYQELGCICLTRYRCSVWRQKFWFFLNVIKLYVVVTLSKTSRTLVSVYCIKSCCQAWEMFFPNKQPHFVQSHLPMLTGQMQRWSPKAVQSLAGARKSWHIIQALLKHLRVGRKRPSPLFYSAQPHSSDHSDPVVLKTPHW